VIREPQVIRILSERLFPGMFAVIADADDNSLVIDCLAVSPFGILRTTFRAVGHKEKPAQWLGTDIICMSV
jgi:hypothetical protein